MLLLLILWVLAVSGALIGIVAAVTSAERRAGGLSRRVWHLERRMNRLEDDLPADRRTP